MSEAREWVDRMRRERPCLNLLATDPSREPSLSADVDPVNAACEIIIRETAEYRQMLANQYRDVLTPDQCARCTGPTLQRILIPHDFAAALGRFLVRTYSTSTKESP